VLLCVVVAETDCPPQPHCPTPPTSHQRHHNTITPPALPHTTDTLPYHQSQRTCSSTSKLMDTRGGASAAAPFKSTPSGANPSTNSTGAAAAAVAAAGVVVAAAAAVAGVAAGVAAAAGVAVTAAAVGLAAPQRAALMGPQMSSHQGSTCGGGLGGAVEVVIVVNSAARWCRTPKCPAPGWSERCCL